MQPLNLIASAFAGGLSTAIIAILVCRRVMKQRETCAIAAERARLARELHDSLSQDLTGMVLMLQAALLQTASRRERDELVEVMEVAERCMRRVRNSLCALRATPESADLYRRIDELAAGVPHEPHVRITVKTSGIPPVLSPSDANQALSIVREALWNAVRHSGASLIEVEASADGGIIDFCVRDNGHGFDPSSRKVGHFGLQGMHERAAETGAELYVSSDRHGTTVGLKVRARTLVQHIG